MPSRLLLFSISSLLLLSLFTTSQILTRASTSKSKTPPDDDDEDLSFLEEADDNKNSPSKSDPHYSDDEAYDDEDFENYDDFEVPEALDEEEDYSNAQIDDKDVVVLTGKNFSDFIDSNKYVMVEFYAPWCGHCQVLAPEYANAATELKEEKVALAKVDATEENELAEEYEVQGFPTVYFFIDGDHKSYTGQRTKDAIVTWIKKKIGPGIYNISTLQDAEHILTSETEVVLGLLNSLEGPDNEELVAASKLEDYVNFYQTVNLDIAKLFHMDLGVKRPALVMLKKEAEKVCHYEGQFTRAAISKFVSANKLPLVTTFTRESAPLIFDSPIKKQLLLFATSNNSDKVVQVFQEAAKHFKGKIIFVYVQMDNEDVGKPVSDHFGITGDAPKVLAYRGNDDSRKYFLDGKVTISNIKAFGEDFLEDKLKPFYKSDPIPKTNDGDVKIVVGNNFDEIVLDESKDVLLEIYAPWCGHCQALEPTYNKLAKHLRGIESLTIAKMDGTTNEHPRAQADDFPTIFFFPAGKKSFDPIIVEADRTVVALYRFIKKHSSAPFKLQKPVPSSNVESSGDKGSIKKSTDPTAEISDDKGSISKSTDNSKDEL